MSCSTEKFNLPHVRANLMMDDDPIFVLTWRDVVDLLWKDRIVADLDEDEMRVFRKCLESGLSCWSEVIELAYRAAISERSGT